MKTSKFNDWLTIISNIAVVAGIVFLGVEFRQNNELLRSESRQALVANDVTSLTMNISHSDVFAKLVSGDTLSSHDQIRLSFMFALDLRNREFEYFQYTNGLLDKEAWLTYLNVVRINHSSGLGRKWWDEIGSGIVDSDFAELVDKMLANSQPDDTYHRMANWADD